jgi:hypothetical protein
MHPLVVLGAAVGGVAFGRAATATVVRRPRPGFNDQQMAVNQLSRACSLAQQASGLINQGTPLMSWQKSKIAVIEDNLQSVIQGLQATKQRPALGFSPSSGVDEALRADIGSYANSRAAAIRDLRAGRVSMEELEDAQEDAQDAVDGLDDAITALRSAAAQLQSTQRGRSEGGRWRLRRLIESTQNLLDTYFQGANKSWDSVLPPLPQTPIGPESFSFGAAVPKPAPMSAYVTVQTDDGPVRIAAASAMTSQDISDLTDGIVNAAGSIQNFAFQAQTRGQGLPILPGAAIQQTLRAESSLIPGGLL